METLTESRLTTNHQEIQNWTEQRGGHPALVLKPKQIPPALRLSFPGYSTGEPLESIPWAEFFEKFEAQRLALRYQETTLGGGQSHFHNLVHRVTGEEHWPGVPLETVSAFRSRKRMKRFARLVS